MEVTPAGKASLSPPAEATPVPKEVSMPAPLPQLRLGENNVKEDGTQSTDYHNAINQKVFVGNVGIQILSAKQLVVKNITPEELAALESVHCKITFGEQTQKTSTIMMEEDAQNGLKCAWNEEFSLAIYANLLRKGLIRMDVWAVLDGGREIHIGRARVKLLDLLAPTKPHQDVVGMELKLKYKQEVNGKVLPKIGGILSVILSPDIIISNEVLNKTLADLEAMETEKLCQKTSRSTQSLSSTGQLSRGVDYTRKHRDSVQKIWTAYKKSKEASEKKEFSRRVRASIMMQSLIRGHLVRRAYSTKSSSRLLRDESGSRNQEAELAEREAEAQMRAAIDESNQRKRQELWPLPYDCTPSSWQPLPDAINVLKVVASSSRIRVMAITWNMCAKNPPTDLKELIPSDLFHIYAIGTEECENSIAKSIVFTAKKQWEATLKAQLGDNYVMLCSHALQAIHHSIFIHRGLLPLVTDVHSAAAATGLGNTLGNKGGIGISFRLGHTSLLFVNCHLEAGQKNYASRNEDVHQICEELDLPSDWTSPNSNSTKRVFDRVFWSGDLNYRINGARQVVDNLIEKEMHKVLVHNDQLLLEMKKGAVFRGFKEGPLNFKPTYKYDENSDDYDSSSKARIQSWTDRILYWTKDNEQGIKLLAYNSVQTIRTSDHRPVYATFDVQLDLNRGVPSHREELRIDQSRSEVCTIQ